MENITQGGKIAVRTKAGPEGVLTVVKMTIGFELLLQSSVDHSFHHLGETACEGNRAEVRWSACGVVDFGNGNDEAFLPFGGKESDSQSLLKRSNSFIFPGRGNF